MTMQLFVRGNCTMIAAPVQSDVDGIPKWSHYVLLKRPNAAVSSRGKRMHARGRLHRVVGRLLRRLRERYRNPVQPKGS